MKLKLLSFAFLAFLFAACGDDSSSSAGDIISTDNPSASSDMNISTDKFSCVVKTGDNRVRQTIVVPGEFYGYSEMIVKGSQARAVVKNYYIGRSEAEIAEVCEEMEDQSDDYDSGSFMCNKDSSKFTITIPKAYASPLDEVKEEMKEECKDYEEEWNEKQAKLSSSSKPASSSATSVPSEPVVDVGDCSVSTIVNTDFLEIDFNVNEKYSTFVDTRDCQIYRTVTIGGDTWLAQNLNYEAETSRCYNDDPNMCETYGRLYDWNTAMDDLCPAGWKLPSRENFINLVNTVMSRDDLMSSAFPNGTNLSGFSAAPAGEYYQGFIYQGSAAVYWINEEYSSSMAYYWYYNTSKGTLGAIDGGGDKRGFKSVRCIKQII